MKRKKWEVAEQNLSLTPAQILNKYWGYTEFRSVQLQIIESASRGVDTLALMPTGGGKSITYQIPALMREGVCVVVSPIIALMKDQVDGLQKRGISAVAIHSGLSRREIDRLLDNCIYGEIKFLFISPERVESEIFLLRLHKMKISLLTVDEAHCISQWGYDFRPSYLNISKIREVIPSIPILALSASATDIVAQDIMSQLKFKLPKIIRSDFSRPNLSYVVRNDDNKRVQIENVLRNVDGSGIIYVRTRDEAQELCEALVKSGVSSTFYHGGIPYAERSIRQEEWIKGKCRVMVATNAFGMGIDKPDVRFVIHYTMCDSLESYYQEAGRAGRDAKRSYALLLVAQSDHQRIQQRVMLEFPPLEQIKNIYDLVCSFLEIPYNEGGFKSYKFNIYKFCSLRKKFGATVRSALNLLEMNGYLTYDEGAITPSKLIFRVSREELYKIRINNNDLEEIINSILRIYGGVFTELKRIDESEIALWCQSSFEDVVERLKELSRLRIIYYISSSIEPRIRLLKDRSRLEELYISPHTYTHRMELCKDRISKMIEYIDNKDRCRSSILESYFGSKQTKECGVCDICLKKKNQASIVENETLRGEILEILNHRKLDVQQLVSQFKTKPETIISCVEKLVEEEKIIYDGPFLKVKS